jgi:hypothetical protein
MFRGAGLNRFASWTDLLEFEKEAKTPFRGPSKPADARQQMAPSIGDLPKCAAFRGGMRRGTPRAGDNARSKTWLPAQRRDGLTRRANPDRLRLS